MSVILQDRVIAVDDPFGIADDPGLPLASLALDPQRVERELQQLPRLAGIDGPPQLRAIRVIRHKPGRRFMVEYDVAVSTALGVQGLTLMGKARSRHSARAAHRLLRALWGAGFDQQGSDAICVPEPIGVISPFNLWLQQKVPGLPLSELLLAGNHTALIKRVVDAIHKLHSAGVAADRLHTIDDELKVLHERLPQLFQQYPEWRQRIERVLAACDQVGASLPVPKVCGIHRDFYADQVMVDGERLYLLDFDLYCYGDPALDIGNFVGHMIEQRLRLVGDATMSVRYEEILVERFIALVGAASREAVTAYTTLTLVRHIYLSTLFPERRNWSGRLLALCEQRLGLPPRTGS